MVETISEETRIRDTSHDASKKNGIVSEDSPRAMKVAEDENLRDVPQGPSEVVGRLAKPAEIVAEGKACPRGILKNATEEGGEVVKSHVRTVMEKIMDGDEMSPGDILKHTFEEGEVVEGVEIASVRKGDETTSFRKGKETPWPKGQETTDSYGHGPSASNDLKTTAPKGQDTTAAQANTDTTPKNTTLANRPSTSTKLQPTTYAPSFFATEFIPGAPLHKFPTPPPDLKITAGSIQFSNVSYSYSNKAAVKPAATNISFCVSPGENIAIVGPPNSGKSTLIKLLLGVLGSHEGTIKIDGVDTSGVSRGSLQSQISVVPQIVNPIDGSVYDNVCSGVATPRRDVEEMCITVGLHEKIMSLPRGYDAPMGAGAVAWSRADLQKLGIARVLAADNRIVLLDQALGAVDRRAECRILRYFRWWGRGRTVITVAHRLGTITLSDRIYVIAGGMLVESGKHGQLMKIEGGIYRKMWGCKGSI